MLTSAEVKKRAKALGADLVGIGNIERWEGAPLQMDPRQIMPNAKSIIGVGFRVMRGSLRGIEEGTMFSNYSAMGYGGITYLFMPMVVMNLCRDIEDAGYEALPMGHQSDWRAIDNKGVPRKNYSKPVAPGKAIPDIMVHLRIAAYLCGMGEIGWSKMFLSPEFGPRQRVGIIITEAELEPDPIYAGPNICDRCMACANACPAGAIKKDKSVKVNLAGHEVEWNDLDCDACDRCFTGAQPTDEEIPKEKQYREPGLGIKNFKPGWWSPFFKKPRNLYNTGQAICGARGCTRACIDHLEKRGKLANKFHRPFRPAGYKPWRVEWEPEAQPQAPTPELGAD